MEIPVFLDEFGKPIFAQYFVPFEDTTPELPGKLRDLATNTALDKSVLKAALRALSIQEVQVVGTSCEYAAKCVWEMLKFRCPIFSPGRELYDYQYSAVRWMKKMEAQPNQGMTGGILAAQMGLGKSLMAAFHILSAPRGKWPSLIICTMTLATQWPDELAKFFGNRVKVLVMTNQALGKDLHKVTADLIQMHDIVITTYSTCAAACKKHNFGKYVTILGEKGIHKDKVVERVQRSKGTVKVGRESRGSRLLYEIPWERIVCDEAHNIPPPRAKMFDAMLALYGKFKWCMTGTVARNKPLELWAQLVFCGYTGTPHPGNWTKASKELMVAHGLRDRIRHMTYETEAITMPPLVERVIDLRFGPNELKVYSYILKSAQQALQQVLNKQLDYSCLLGIFTMLRLTCLAPFMLVDKKSKALDRTSTTHRAFKKEKKRRKQIRNIQPKIDEPPHHQARLEVIENHESENGEHENVPVPKKTADKIREWIVDQEGGSLFESSKCKELTKLINAVPKNEKLVVFSAFSSYLHLIRDHFIKKGIGCAAITGKTKSQDRVDILNTYKSPSFIRSYLTFCRGVTGEQPSSGFYLPAELRKLIWEWCYASQPRVLFLSYKVGSEGLNLIHANHVVFMEPWWNSAVMNQAKQRCWRLGQTSSVTVHSLVFNYSIEKQILELCKHKAQIEKVLITGENQDVKKSKASLSLDFLYKLLNRRDIGGAEDEDPTNGGRGPLPTWF
jgi:SNF2 family DNA or RNA helicase